MNSNNFYGVILFCIISCTSGLNAFDSFSDVVNESLVDEITQSLERLCTCISTGKSNPNKVVFVQTEEELIFQYLKISDPDIFLLINSLAFAITICPKEKHDMYDEAYAQIRSIIVGLLNACIFRAYHIKTINLQDAQGDTIFHKITAIRKYLTDDEFAELMLCLTSCNANKTIKNNRKLTPFDYLPQQARL